MAEETLLDQLVAREGEKERRAVLHRSKEEAEKIRAAAEEDARRTRARKTPLYEARAELARTRLVHQAQFDIQVKTTQAKQKIWDEMLAQVAKKLSEISKQSGYRALLAGLLEEALQLTDQPVRVHSRAEDAPSVKETLGRLKCTEAEVVGNLSGWGGIRLASLDGKMSLDNTLESRFAKAQEVYKEEIAKELFG